jgi:hypothetical protein
VSEPPLPPLPDLCWPVDWSCADPSWVEDMDPGVKARAEALAVSTLRSLTAYQVGGCPVTVRPCAESCGRTSYVAAPVLSGTSSALGGPVGQWWPHIDAGGDWTNTACGCTSGCSCEFVPEVILPGPVGRVDSVYLDGAELDPNAYRVDNGNRLVRMDGGVWPSCQHMARPLGAPGTFGVTYLQGIPVDGLGAFVAGKLAVEFAMACSGGQCALPSGVTSIARQGVTMEVSTGMFPGNVTGIVEVDAWVRIWNPNALVMPSTVWSPDVPRARQVTIPRGFGGYA